MPAGPCTGCGFDVSTSGVLSIAGVQPLAWPYAGSPNTLRCDPVTGRLWTEPVVPHRLYRAIAVAQPPYGPLPNGGFSISTGVGVGVHQVTAASSITVVSHPQHQIAARLLTQITVGYIGQDGTDMLYRTEVAIGPPYGTGAFGVNATCGVSFVTGAAFGTNLRFPPTIGIGGDWITIPAGGPSLTVQTRGMVEIAAVGNPGTMIALAGIVTEVATYHV